MRLKTAHLAVLEFLTWQVRLASDAQVQQMLNAQSGPSCQASRALRQLATAGLIHRERIFAAVPVLSQPLCCWFPGQRMPNLSSLAWRLLVRNEQANRCQVQVNWASLVATNVTAGSTGWRRQPLQLQHDLGTTAMFVSSQPSQSNLVWSGTEKTLCAGDSETSMEKFLMPCW
jgi:hypothetical protein